MKKLCECGLFVADLEKARREHLKSAKHKSRVAASKQAGALGGFIKKQPEFPTPKQIAETDRANPTTDCTDSAASSSASASASTSLGALAAVQGDTQAVQAAKQRAVQAAAEGVALLWWLAGWVGGWLSNTHTHTHPGGAGTTLGPWVSQLLGEWVC